MHPPPAGAYAAPSPLLESNQKREVRRVARDDGPAVPDAVRRRGRDIGWGVLAARHLGPNPGALHRGRLPSGSHRPHDALDSLLAIREGTKGLNRPAWPPFSPYRSEERVR